MKEKIEGMIRGLTAGDYDEEEMHIKYDNLLVQFILNYDESLLPLMKELIALEKNFWYA